MPIKPARRTGSRARRIKRIARRTVKVWRRVKRWWRPAPRPAKFLMAALVLLILWLGINWIYQVVRKPSQLVFPVSGTLYNSPGEALAAYAPSLRKFATPV